MRYWTLFRGGSRDLTKMETDAKDAANLMDTSDGRKGGIMFRKRDSKPGDVVEVYIVKRVVKKGANTEIYLELDGKGFDGRKFRSADEVTG